MALHTPVEALRLMFDDAPLNDPVRGGRPPTPGEPGLAPPAALLAALPPVGVPGVEDEIAPKTPLARPGLPPMDREEVWTTSLSSSPPQPPPYLDEEEETPEVKLLERTY